MLCIRLMGNLEFASLFDRVIDYFVIFSLMVPLVEFLGQNHFHSNFKVYTDDMCTFHNQISDFRFSVNTAGLILLFYMLVILGIMFREFKFRNIMS